jgi:hypothetical protein
MLRLRIGAVELVDADVIGAVLDQLGVIDARRRQAMERARHCECPHGLPFPFLRL